MEWALAPNPLFNGFPIDEFHRIKVFASLAAEVKNRCDVAMAHLCSSAGLREKTCATRLVRQIARVNDFQRDLTAQACIKRFVGNTHGTATKLDWRAIIAGNQLVLVESMESCTRSSILVT